MQAVPQNGGIAQGLGKTVTVIALLVSNKVEPDRKWQRVSVDFSAAKSRKRPRTLFGAKPGDAVASTSQSTAGAGAGASAATSDAKAAAAAPGAGATEAATGGSPGPSGGEPPACTADPPPSSRAASSSCLVAACSALDERAAGGTATEASPAPSDTTAAVDIDALPDAPRSRDSARDAAARSGLPAAGTLIVVPTSLLTQWEAEIKSKVRPPVATAVAAPPAAARALLTPPAPRRRSTRART